MRRQRDAPTFHDGESESETSDEAATASSLSVLTIVAPKPSSNTVVAALLFASGAQY